MQIKREENGWREEIWTVHMLPTDAPEGLAIHRKFGDIGNPPGYHNIWLTKDDARALRAEIEKLWPSDVPDCCGYDWRKSHTTIGRGDDGFMHRKGCANGPGARFPVGDYENPYGTVPWHIGEEAWREYNKGNYGQSCERIAERGGFGYSEMDTFRSGWREFFVPNKQT